MGENEAGGAFWQRLLRKPIAMGAFALLIIVAAWLGAYRHRIEARVKAGVAAVAAEASRYGSVDYATVRVGYVRPSVRISDIRIRTAFLGPELYIESLVIRRFSDDPDGPVVFQATASGVEMPAGEGRLPLPDMAKVLGLAGYRADVTVDCRYVRDHRTLEVRRLEISSPQLGTASMALAISNLDLQGLPLYIIMPHALMFKGLAAVYRDEAFTAPWKYQGPDLSGRGNPYVLRIRNYCREALIAAESAGKALQAENFRQLLAFMDDPRRLCVTARPDQPLSLGQIIGAGDPAELMDLLQMRIRSNKQAYAKTG